MSIHTFWVVVVVVIIYTSSIDRTNIKVGRSAGTDKGVGHGFCLCAARPFVHLRIGRCFMGISGVLWAGCVCTGARETDAECTLTLPALWNGANVYINTRTQRQWGNADDDSSVFSLFVNMRTI